MTSGRPRKKCVIRKRPETFRFSPRGRRGKPDNVLLNMECFEALRLADYAAMRHIEAAKLMNISRQTFERVLKKARRTVSDAIINGKGIKIWGGSYDFSLDS